VNDNHTPEPDEIDPTAQLEEGGLIGDPYIPAPDEIDPTAQLDDGEDEEADDPID